MDLRSRPHTALSLLGTLVVLTLSACEGPGVLTDLTPASLDIVPSTEVGITIAPHALVLGVEGTWVTVHTDVRYGSAVNTSLMLDGVPAAFAYADDRGYLVVKFTQGAIEAIVTPPDASLTLTGWFTDGTPFFGVDTILVRVKPIKDPPKPGR